MAALSPKQRAALASEFRYRARLKLYRANPLKWLKERMGISPEKIKWDLYPEYATHAWDSKGAPVTPNGIYQIFEGLAMGQDVGVESATGMGKTYAAALAVYYFLDCYPAILDKTGTKVIDPGALVVTVASKEKQLREVLWKEIGRHWDTFQALHPEAELQDLKIRMRPNDPKLKDAWGAIGLTASVRAGEESSTKFQGIHAPNMLFVLDEVTGIHPAILEAIENTLTAENNLRLVLGNPESVSDVLHRFCLEQGVRHIRLSAWDHPNIVLGREVIPGAVTLSAINRRLRKYRDPNHRMVLSRIHGVSPSTSGKTLFPSVVLDAASDHVVDPVETLPTTGLSVGQTWIYRPRVDGLPGRYLIFADVAGDRSESGDYHAAVVLDRVTKEIAAVVHQRGPRKDYITALLRLADRYAVRHGQTGKVEFDAETGTFNDVRKTYMPLLAFESDGVGGLHLDPRMDRYPRLYKRRNLDVQGAHKRRTREVVGWNTNSKTRPEMTGALEDWAISLYDNPERLTSAAVLTEARTFSYDEQKKRFEHESGHHDDLIMALAGAVLLDSITPGPNPERVRRATGDPQTPYETAVADVRREAARRAEAHAASKAKGVFGPARFTTSFDRAKLT